MDRPCPCGWSGRPARRTCRWPSLAGLLGCPAPPRREALHEGHRRLPGQEHLRGGGRRACHGGVLQGPNAGVPRVISPNDHPQARASAPAGCLPTAPPGQIRLAHRAWASVGLKAPSPGTGGLLHPGPQEFNNLMQAKQAIPEDRELQARQTLADMLEGLDEGGRPGPIAPCPALNRSICQAASSGIATTLRPHLAHLDRDIADVSVGCRQHCPSVGVGPPVCVLPATGSDLPWSISLGPLWGALADCSAPLGRHKSPCWRVAFPAGCRGLRGGPQGSS
jgi:hypothetical protein